MKRLFDKAENITTDEEVKVVINATRAIAIASTVAMLGLVVYTFWREMKASAAGKAIWEMYPGLKERLVADGIAKNDGTVDTVINGTKSIIDELGLN